jgi:hypothetical protein
MVEQTLNEKIIRISGSGCINQETKIELGEDREVLVRGSVVKVEEKDNFDGTKDLIYHIRILTVEITK